MLAALSLMTLAAERIGGALAFATMLLNLAWALGEMIGAPAAASLSAATSDTVPLAVLAVAMLLTHHIGVASAATSSIFTTLREPSAFGSPLTRT